MSGPGLLQKAIYYARVAPFSYLLRQVLRRLPFSCTAHYPEGKGKGERPFQRPNTFDLSQVVAAIQIDKDVAEALCDAYLEHRFDVLGSAWLSFGYSEDAPGLEGHSYHLPIPSFSSYDADDYLSVVIPMTAESGSRPYWTQLRALAPHYAPIDWQRDPVSGFRWNAKVAAAKQSALHRGYPGADPLRPLNLGRLLHLPRLALLAHALPEQAPALVREYEAQVLDFTAANPVGWGIQWSVAIDVAVRTANLVLGHWLLQATGCAAMLSRQFDETMAALLQQHGKFLYEHLEYNAGNTGNHYLAGLTGLLFAARYLEPSQEVLHWERRALQGLPRELKRQFYPDGGHFEGSSCYHAFCTELLAWCYALSQGKRIEGLSSPEFPDRLGRAFDLLQELRTPDGGIPQFGDNDSARLFRLLPHGVMTKRGEAAVRYTHLRGFPDAVATHPYFDENALHYADIENLRNSTTIEGRFYQAIAGARAVDALIAVGPAIEPVLRRSPNSSLPYTLEKSFGTQADLCDGLQRRIYPESGLYIYRSPSLYLAICAHTNPAQKLNLSHSHNDKLGVELYLEGLSVLRDPGSYVYGALPLRRNLFRSGKAHCVPVVEGLEQNRFVDLFTSYPDARCALLMLSERELLLELCYGSVVLRRQITIKPREVCIRDSGNRPFRQNWGLPNEYSPGYGKLEALP